MVSNRLRTIAVTVAVLIVLAGIVGGMFLLLTVSWIAHSGESIAVAAKALISLFWVGERWRG